MTPLRRENVSLMSRNAAHGALCYALVSEWCPPGVEWYSHRLVFHPLIMRCTIAVLLTGDVSV